MKLNSIDQFHQMVRKCGFVLNEDFSLDIGNEYIGRIGTDLVMCNGNPISIYTLRLFQPCACMSTEGKYFVDLTFSIGYWFTDKTLSLSERQGVSKYNEYIYLLTDTQLQSVLLDLSKKYREECIKAEKMSIELERKNEIAKH